MTPQEFKAWFEGFTEAFAGVPTKAQWARVKERVSEIDGKPVTERVFVDRYWPTYINQYPPYPRPYWQATCGAYSAASGANNAATYLAAVGQNTVGQNAVSNTVFNSSAAMLELGRADAKSLAA